MLDGHHPHRHTTGQAGGDVGELHGQLTERLLILPRGEASGAHGLRGGGDPDAVLLEFGVVEVEILGIEHSSLAEVPQAALHVVQPVELANHRVDLAEQFGQFPVLVLDGGRTLLQPAGGSAGSAADIADPGGRRRALRTELVNGAGGDIELGAGLLGALGSILQGHFDRLDRSGAGGAFGRQLVDRCCRRPYLATGVPGFLGNFLQGSFHGGDGRRRCGALGTQLVDNAAGAAQIGIGLLDGLADPSNRAPQVLHGLLPLGEVSLDAKREFEIFACHEVRDSCGGCAVILARA
ncbi:hypothetical protein FQZ97_359900 [compost metagenome]